MSTEEQSNDRDVLLRCERLVIGYQGRALLPPIDLVVRRGSFLAVIGRNGSGKSTWFKTVLGILPPLSGQVRRCTPRPRIAYVPQIAKFDAVFPIRASEVVLWGRQTNWGFLAPFASSRDLAICAAALKSVGASDLANVPFRELSEGQKQRVLFARVLATEADIALLDEPTAAMDVVAERESMDWLGRLVRDQGLAVVVVSHVLSLAARCADQVLFLDRDDGLVLTGKPQTVLAHPVFRRQFGEVELPHAG